MGAYSIKDLEQLSGVKAHTIRIWEQRYSLLSPDRSDTNIRTYSDAELKKLLRVNVLYSNGMKISKIAMLNENQISERISELLREEETEKNVIEVLTMAMVDMDEAKFEDVLSQYIDHHGFDHLMQKIVYPFLERIGTLWMVNAINPGQEHFMSNLIRQKIIKAIDDLGPTKDKKAQVCISFLHEDEMHELGLLYYSYVLKKNGLRVIYLGQSVPFQDLQSAVKAHQPNYLLTAFVGSVNEPWLNDYVDELSDLSPETKILCSGIQSSLIRSNRANVSVLSQVDDLIKLALV